MSPTPIPDCLTTTLPIPADLAYRYFLDVASTPDWLPIVRTARVYDSDPDGRPLSASFMVSLERASVSYRLLYQHSPKQRRVAFHTPPGEGMWVAGHAHFNPLGPEACMMEYELAIDADGLPPWLDPFFDNHAPSAVLTHFRDYLLNRALPLAC